MSKNIDDAYRKWVESHNDGDVLYCKKAFIAGAQWQKEQMLKDAVDAHVSKIGGSGFVKEERYSTLMAYLDRFKDGDKVKVIIVKEGEK